MSKSKVRFGSIHKLDIYPDFVILSNMHGSCCAGTTLLLLYHWAWWLLWHCWRLHDSGRRRRLLFCFGFNDNIFLFDNCEIGAWLCGSSWILNETCKDSRVIWTCIVDDQSGWIVWVIDSDIISTLELKCIPHPFDYRPWTGFKFNFKNCFLVFFYTNWF